jgi:hypothetical protein
MSSTQSAHRWARNGRPREVLHEGATKALHGRAGHLAVQGWWVDDSADILDDKIIDEFHSARPRINGDMRRRRTIGIGEPLIAM